MIRRVISCFALILAFGVLVGCSGSSTSTKPATSGAGPTGKDGGEKKLAPVESAGNVPPPPGR